MVCYMEQGVIRDIFIERMYGLTVYLMKWEL